MSFSKNIQHLTFATKSRRPTLVATHRRVAYAMMWEILKKMNVFVYRIGGVEDHVHILCDVPGTIGISEVMNKVKGASSYELNRDKRFPLSTAGRGVIFRVRARRKKSRS